jgi:hypothetical protein
LNSFNGPVKRAELLLFPQYAASNDFLAAGKWSGEKNFILSSANNEDDNTTLLLYCIVVGVISAEKAYLEKHGNFNTKFNTDASKAKIQFSVIRPNDPDFGPDFNKAIVAFEEYQQRASQTPCHHFFLLWEGHIAMRMSFPLFELKVCTQNNFFECKLTAV